MRSTILIGLALSRAIFFAACLSVALFALAKPDREDPAKKPAPIPNVAGQSRWGLIEQAQGSNKVKIDGHPHWYVEYGEIRKDGKLFVIWILRADGRAAPGLYEIDKDGGITSLWGWGPDCTQDDKGEWHGLTQPDELRPKPMMPEIQ